jgi:hypothetical protein
LVRLRHPRTYVDTEQFYTGVSHRLEPTAGACDECAWPDRCEKDGLCWKAEKAAIAEARTAPKQSRWGDTRNDWTRESVVDALTAWNHEHGKPPTMREWVVGTPHHPGVSTVRRLFGNWRTGLEAAGLEAKIGGWNSRPLR